jgi:hypothetical protein
MPANSTGWFWHSLAHATSRLGHLYSPGAQRGPWPWFPYALDNGAFACWDRDTNVFDESKWRAVEADWNRLILWAQCAATRPLWAIVPDVPGDAAATLERWGRFAPQMGGFMRALAVQDGMTVEQVEALRPLPDVVAVGGSTTRDGKGGWKWDSAQMWAAAFPRVHMLRCNSPERLYDLERWGYESCDGTGWNRGDRTQTEGLERWARSRAVQCQEPLWPFVCRQNRNPQQETFA